MEFPLLKSLGEVQAELKSVLNGLGLKAKLDKHLGANVIVFETADGRLSSPVFVKLRDNAIVGYRCPYFERLTIGDTGWTYDAYEMGGYTREVKAADADFYKELREAIQENVILKHGSGHAAHTNDENFAKAFDPIMECFWRDDEQVEIKCSRSADGIEGYDFSIFDCEWRISFEGEKAILRRDDSVFGAVRATEVSQISAKLSAELKRLRPNTFKI
ncbi:hypothetical protein [Rhizobium sp.]|uniref:hypothetical protein n=1 Tax=Rhizobium sp. TaxID=391 RepID=UPI0028AA3CF4